MCMGTCSKLRKIVGWVLTRGWVLARYFTVNASLSRAFNFITWLLVVYAICELCVVRDQMNMNVPVVYMYMYLSRRKVQITSQKTQRQTEAEAVTIIKPQGGCKYPVTN